MSLRPLNWQMAKSQFRACWHLQKTSLNLEPVDIYKRQVSSFSPTRTTLSLLASQSVMSLWPLNRQTAKSQFQACWHLQKTSLNLEPVDIYKRQVSILVDIYKRQVSLTLSLVASQSVMSLRPLNQQTAKSQFWACWHLQKTSLNFEPVDIYKRHVSMLIDIYKR